MVFGKKDPKVSVESLILNHQTLNKHQYNFCCHHVKDTMPL
ncbi:hypothetical protein GMES_2115 [Paraglaciecola mesophila KMM 241]|uniref:Uncharacterized protein n=1 Tax=Paraglaciecola mesophila KMM 241 TaxID=1128912 RepID=K6YK99_9ALTE|nr:hypothetical protein GMES_2115 [Paraglaciecola mesophila KMM 241]